MSQQIALVTGVGDNESFAWFISKSLQAAGAKVVLACHPRMMGIVESILTRDMDRESRLLPDGKTEFKPAKVLASWSCASWQRTQSRTPAIAVRRASGISALQSAQRMRDAPCGRRL